MQNTDNICLSWSVVKPRFHFAIPSATGYKINRATETGRGWLFHIRSSLFNWYRSSGRSSECWENQRKPSLEILDWNRKRVVIHEEDEEGSARGLELTKFPAYLWEKCSSSQAFSGPTSEAPQVQILSLINNKKRNRIFLNKWRMTICFGSP